MNYDDVETLPGGYGQIECEHIFVDCSADPRPWWQKLWDDFCGVKWEPKPVTITLPDLPPPRAYVIKKLDSSSAEVIIKLPLRGEVTLEVRNKKGGEEK